MYFPHFSNLIYHFLSADINNISTFYSPKTSVVPTVRAHCHSFTV